MSALRPRGTPEQRFWGHVDAEGDCWEWIGKRGALGYGRFYVRPTPAGRYNEYAHRFAYEALVGPIPAGMVIDHLCRNRGCVNPDHLEIVTNRTNILRGFGFSARAVRRTHCPQGHEYNSENTVVTPSSHRRCRTCLRNHVRLQSQARKIARHAARLAGCVR